MGTDSTAAEHGGRRRSLLLRALLVPVGLLVGLVLAEGLAWVINPPGNSDLLFDAYEALPRGFYVTDPELLAAPAPGFRGELHTLGRRVPLRINRAGLRGPDAPAGGWLVLGDSFTMALQVPEQQTFQARLQAATGQRFHNGGVDGYSTWQAAKRYELLAPSVRPRGVVLVFFLGNDLGDNERFPSVIQGARNDPPGRPLPFERISPLTRLLMGYSHLYAHLRVWRRGQVLGRKEHRFFQQWHDELSIFTRGGAALLQRQAGPTEAALQALKQQAAQNGHDLLVALAPPAFQVMPGRVEATLGDLGLDPQTATLDAPLKLVLGLLRRHGIRACDLVPALRASIKRGDSPYFTFDGHWTRVGHQVVADALAACLKKSP